MYVSSNECGICAQGHLQDITAPLLLALLEKGQVTGELQMGGAYSRCQLHWEQGSIVAIEWPQDPLELHDQSERALVSLLAKQSAPLFGIVEGEYSFTSTEAPALRMLSPGRLPLAFFIRYGLASTQEKGLTHQLFDAAFGHEPVVQLSSESQLKTLGAKAEKQLKAYRKKTQVLAEETQDTMRQLLVALWAVDWLQIEPASPTHMRFEAMQIFFAHEASQAVEQELPSPFAAGGDETQEHSLFREVEGGQDSYVGLVSIEEGELPGLYAVEESSMPEISPQMHQAIQGPQAIATLLSAMEQWRASDLFLSQGKSPAARIHGQVLTLPLPALELLQFDGFLNQTLSDASLRKFHGSGDLDVGYSLDERRRFRLNLHRQKGSLGLVARAIPSGDLSFDELGLPKALRVMASQPRGLVLVTGATGSGKSTTLASMIHFINQHRHAHIVTIEEPIEFVHRDLKSRITQREVGADTDSFHSALKHVVRESPDVILIGEMRDMETMSVALSAALTGHLVLASLHTVNAVQTLQRIMSYYPDHMRHQAAMDLSLSLQGIISQRLIPAQQGDRRVAAIEILACTPAVAQLLRQERIEELSDHLKTSNDPHSQSFNQALLKLYRDGDISFEMGRAYATNPEEFALSAQGIETGVATFRHSGPDEGVTGLDIKTLLQIVIDRRASDLHLTTGRPPILRINGELVPLPYAPLTEGDMRLLLFSILSTRQRTHFQLERELDFALALDDGQRFRINAYHQKGKMAAAMRAIPSEIPDPADLEIPEQVMLTADHPHGLLLVVGPTGSGKSTTLACMIDRINRTRSCRIITIEDPIEFTHTSKNSTVDQREVYADTKDFASALKYILRQDPDVVLVGEMRDIETISAAMTAAETGHLVLATLHTNDAIQTIARIIDVFPAHQQSQIRSQLASSLLGVVSQRLLPRALVKGRIAAFEIMLANPAIRNLIREDKMHQARSIIESSRSAGMITLDYALQALVQEGKVTQEDAMRFVLNPQVLTDASKKKRGNQGSAYYR